jgi:hypothetical protein
MECEVAQIRNGWIFVDETGRRRLARIMFISPLYHSISPCQLHIPLTVAHAEMETVTPGEEIKRRVFET